jgi:hypothetical protein
MSSDSLFIQRNRTATRTVTQSFTRPADTNAYTAGDTVNNSTSAPTVLTFTGMAREPGRGGTIQSAVLTMSSVASLAAELDLYLFDTAPTMQSDNAPWTPSDSEIQSLVAIISFYSVLRRTSANNVQYVAGSLGQSYTCLASTTNLFGLLVARNAYVPASAEQFTLRLMSIVD